MIYFKENYATIWEVDNKGKYSIVRMTTSRKDKQSGEWLNSNWNFARFFGDAHEALSDIENGARVMISGTVDVEPYINKEGKKVFPQSPTIKVFQIAPIEGADVTPKGKPRMDTPPTVKSGDVSKDELPF